MSLTVPYETAAFAGSDDRQRSRTLAPHARLPCRVACVGRGRCRDLQRGSRPGSLISFPILVAMGYPALTANITNTIGLWPAYVASAAGFRRQIGASPVGAPPPGRPGGRGGRSPASPHYLSSYLRRRRPLARLGAAELFAFNRAAACPRSRFGPSADAAGAPDGRGVRRLVVRRLLRRRDGCRVARRPRPGLARRRSPRERLLCLALHDGQRDRRPRLPHYGGLAWEAVALLAAGSLAGGYARAWLALALPAPALRVAIVVIGVGTAVKLLV
jgi:uncharacterized protein